jgi:class 3 adenylate cyclase
LFAGVAEVAETRYARAVDGGGIAYQRVGDGPVDVLVSHSTYFPVDLMWDEPRLVHFLTRLSSFCRHTWFDPRGTGASDWIPHAEGRLIESVVDDMAAVLDAVGVERAVILGLESPIGLLFAATHPERTAALVLVNPTARMRRAEDYPQGLPDRVVDDAYARTADGSDAGFLRRVAPSLADDIRFRRWLDRAMRLTCPPADRLWRLRGSLETDLREVLGSIHAPTLVVNRQDRQTVEQGRYVARCIENAQYVEVPGSEILSFVGDADAVVDAIEVFVTGDLAPSPRDRMLATVLFTDIVDSTRRAASVGDRRWREILATHDVLIRDLLDEHRGRAVKFTGDGVLATFDGPARAVRCACAIRDAVSAVGIEIRAGLHAGEIEVRGDDIAGIAVHIGQRVESLAKPGEVLVSRTVADLLVGSGFDLSDRGERELKGVPGTWKVFTVLA